MLDCRQLGYLLNAIRDLLECFLYFLAVFIFWLGGGDVLGAISGCLFSRTRRLLFRRVYCFFHALLAIFREFLLNLFWFRYVERGDLVVGGGALQIRFYWRQTNTHTIVVLALWEWLGGYLEVLILVGGGRREATGVLGRWVGEGNGEVFTHFFRFYNFE